MTERLNVLVLFGGCSPEYGVSLLSAYSVLKFMDKDKYRPVTVGISEEGDWYYYKGERSKIRDNTWRGPADCTPAVLSLDRSRHELLVFPPEGIKRIPVDIVFPILHGRNGEDGTVQGAAELAGIPLAGCPAVSSALCMDKGRAHALARLAGIPAPGSFVISDREYDKALEQGSQKLREKAEKLGYPLFVKPLRAGSSYGITRIEKPEELEKAVLLALEYDTQVIIEEAVEGFEVGCSVIGNDELTVGEVDEIELSDGFFDYTEKYTLKTSAIHVPARISAKKADQIKQTAKTIFRALGCRGFARVDMFLKPDGSVLFNEVNTIPGFTEHSRFPNMLKAAGLSFDQVITDILRLAAASGQALSSGKAAGKKRALT